MEPAGIASFMPVPTQRLDRLRVASLESFLQPLVQFGIPTADAREDSDSRDKRSRESFRFSGDL
jgi:hypothetical protein